jgi:hypothetical protein
MSHNPNHEDYNSYLWSGFGVVFGTNFVGALVVMMHKDIVWCVAATWICVSIWLERPKPVPIYVRTFSVEMSSYYLLDVTQVTEMFFTVLHPFVLVAVYALALLRRRRDGQIALPRDDDDDVQRHGPREIQSEEWT